MESPNLVQRCELNDGRLTYDYMGSTEFEIGGQPKSLKRIFASGMVWSTVLISAHGQDVTVHLVAGEGFSFEEYQPYLQAMANDELRMQEGTEFSRALKQHLGGPLDRFEFETRTNVWFDFENDVLWVLTKNKRKSLVKWIRTTVQRWLDK
jgi:hypothetical protein